MKSDERDFLLAVFTRTNNAYLKQRTGASPRDLIGSGKFGHPKRLQFILKKWTDLGWYEFGVSLDLGWLRPEGIDKATALRQQRRQRGPISLLAKVWRWLRRASPRD